MRAHAALAIAVSVSSWLVVGTGVPGVASPRLIYADSTAAFRREPPGKALETRVPKEGPIAFLEPDPFQQIAWLNGCWRLEDSKRVVEEEWSIAGDARMLGVGREYRKPKLAATEGERTRIDWRDGRFIYLSVPMDQPPDSFPAIEASARRIVFENKAHDFPQRIGYERVTADSVVAWVEGPGAGGVTKHIEYPYHRVACGAAGTAR